MTDLVVEPQAAPLRGLVPVPSDKSITHRALLLSAIARGTSRIRTGGEGAAAKATSAAAQLGEDNRSTMAALRALGVGIEERAGELVVEGVGIEGLREPGDALDCGNSGTTMRLLMGMLAAQRFRSVLVGDASLSRRPMARVATPLRLRGARVEGRIDPKRVGELTAPLELGPLPVPNQLSSLHYDLPIPSAQVKSALLLSGLWAAGVTVVSEPVVSRDHTERMLAALGAPVRRIGPVVELDGPAFGGELPAFELTIPGDLSAAAFVVAAGLLVPGSDVGVRAVGTNPTRSGFVDVVRSMGAHVVLTTTGDALDEPIGELRAMAGDLRGALAGGELVARSIDEVPVLAAIAARARGVTQIVDAGELRVKESDRLATMARVLRAFGVRCEELPDGLVVEGQPDGPLRAADVASEGDHRIAMSAALLGLVADGPTRVRDVDAIATSFPRFAGTMRALGARMRVIAGDES
jgi:3-phosphoshikimate 1-carboxyvinyltransferase